MADQHNTASADDIVHGSGGGGAEEATVETVGLLESIVQEVLGSYLNMALVVVIAVLLYKILRGRNDEAERQSAPPAPQLPRLRRDFTIQELKPFDGTQPDGRVLMAVDGTVYDVTKGKSFYGPGGPYAAFAGKDASRGLATFSVTASDEDKYDDLSDLSKMEMDSVKEWAMQFNEKYLVVGKLLKPGEEHGSYTDEEDGHAKSEDVTLTAAEAEDAAKAAAAAAASVTDVDAHGDNTKPKAE